MAVFGGLCSAYADGTLVWDMSFTGTSTSPNASNIVVKGQDGNAYTTLTPTFDGGSVTDGVYNSDGSRLYFTDSASPLDLKNSFSFVVQAELTEDAAGWPVLFGLGEADDWNLKVAHDGETHSWQFLEEGYELTSKSCKEGTATTGKKNTFIVTVDAGENDGVYQQGTSALTLYLNGKSIAEATLATGNRTNEDLDTFSLGGRPYNTGNTHPGEFSNVQLYQGVLSSEQIASLSVPEPATASLSLLGLSLLMLRRKR